MRITILGAGAWGTALAGVLGARDEVLLWARDPGQAAAIAATRRNERYLPGTVLPDGVAVSADLDAALADARLVLLAVPVAALRPLAGALRTRGHAGPVVWLSKGLERDTHLLAHQIMATELPGVPAGPLSGPSFAEEVARGLPTALVVAGGAGLCAAATAVLHGGNLRIYSSDDVVGVEVGGAVKNVLAIAAGIADALELGTNARAALVTRGLAETRRFGEALGAQAETFMGLAGLGDLVLTCTGDLSRNRRVGLALGRGADLATTLRELGHVAEGVWSAPAIIARARAASVEMPICEAVCAVLDSRVSPRAAVERLLARDPRMERQ